MERREISHLFTIFIIIGYVHTLAFNEEETTSGLIFTKLANAKISYDTYTIVYHIDLEKFFDIKERVEDSMNTFEQYCKGINSTIFNETCNNLLNQIRIKTTYMTRDEQDILAYQQNKNTKNSEYPSRSKRSSIPYNPQNNIYGIINENNVHKFDNKMDEIIKNSNPRQKRSIDFIGAAYHWAFGLMDAETARAYDSVINQLIDETERIKLANQNTTAFIRETIRTVNHTFAKVQDQFVELNKAIENLKKNHLIPIYGKVVDSEAKIMLFEIYNTILSLMHEHQRLSHQILKTLEHAFSGRINQLISIQTLVQDLFSIHRTLPHSQMLPIDFFSENPLRIFTYSKIDATLFGKRLLLRITLPILEREQFSVYEFIPIPTFIDNKTIIINPSNRYMLISDSEYIPISKEELDQSKYTIKQEKIITPKENSYLDIYQNCELNIFRAPKEKTIIERCDVKLIPTMNYFVSINHNDLFYVAIKDPITITEYCEGKSMRTYQLNKSGKLTLEKGCKVTTEEISIRPRIDYKLHSDEHIILSNYSQTITKNAFTKILEFAKNITIPHLDKDIIIKDFTKDFEKLAHTADELVEQSKWDSKIEKIYYDNIESDYFIYWIIGLVVILTVIGIILLGFYISKKFYNIDTWVKLADVLGSKHSNNVPKLFIKNNPEETNETNP